MGIKSQKGLTLIELSMSIAILSSIMFGLYKLADVYQKNLNRDGFVEVLGHMIESAQGWQLEYVKEHELAWLSYNNTEIWDTWPDSLDALIDSPHYTFSSCSKAQEAQGRCFRGDGVYWSDRHVTQQKAINPHTFGYAYYFIIPLAELAPGGSAGNQDWAQYMQILSPLLKRGAERLTNNDVRIEVPVLQDAFAYSDMVWRNGSKPLTGDWDVGGDYGITNVKDVTLKASNGSQIPVSSKLSESTTAKHGDWVDKPQCIRGQTAQANLSISSIDVDTRYYTLLGGLKPYILSQTATQWRVGISISVKINSTGRETILTSGEALLTAYCR